MWAWLRMLCSVPTGISDFLGTMAVSTTSPERRTNLTWLPFWLVSTKPAASRRRLTSRKRWGLSRPNLDLDQADLRRPCGLQRFEVQFNRFLEIGKHLFLGVALAGNVEFEALGDIPRPLAPNGSRKWSLHELIVSKARALRGRPGSDGSESNSVTHGATGALLASSMLPTAIQPECGMVGACQMGTS